MTSQNTACKRGRGRHAFHTWLQSHILEVILGVEVAAQTIRVYSVCSYQCHVHVLEHLRHLVSTTKIEESVPATRLHAHLFSEVETG